MKLRIALTALILSLPSLAAAAGCSHDRRVMSCAEGTVYDHATGTCVSDATT
ncbi:carbohydrate-binding module family 14 protein [Sulfitobacter aestuarii]|uniref:Carbohydrate-binding module family 14 protein n=1 Tax=Sulfitobacter aestuarii TaxID=2161676 RepID=A0ABW5U108_9RHOB